MKKIEVSCNTKQSSIGEMLAYMYFIYCEDRQTHQCYPSYSTIGEAVDMNKNTVKKHVKGFEKKGLIITEYQPLKPKTDERITAAYSILSVLYNQ